MLQPGIQWPGGVIDVQALPAARAERLERGPGTAIRPVYSMKCLGASMRSCNTRTTNTPSSCGM